MNVREKTNKDVQYREKLVQNFDFISFLRRKKSERAGLQQLNYALFET